MSIQQPRTRGRTRGIDPRPVVPRALPASATVRCASPGTPWAAPRVRAALLDLVVRAGRLLRRPDQVARSLTRTLKFAGNCSWEKTRRLVEPSAHDEDLRILACQLMDATDPQRGRAGPAAAPCRPR
ncbi:hypothetical protein ACFV7R_30620 [Streptomyces sp. NPDC059866]|uniref:DinB/UmuC family translesion DNA polymerase n=1 Tax=Streptomyces sp. NPDC059866 TaxID=3346978 RepID=UPI00366A4B7B